MSQELFFGILVVLAFAVMMIYVCFDSKDSAKRSIRQGYKAAKYHLEQGTDPDLLISVALNNPSPSNFSKGWKIACREKKSQNSLAARKPIPFDHPGHDRAGI